jgi:hypothetical protein
MHHSVAQFTRSSFVVLLLCVTPATAQDRGAVKALAARIDQFIEARWAKEKVRPSAPADDSVFLRRVYLDIVGCIPSAAEARDFIEDPASDKRLLVVENLLKSPGYARHFATVTRKHLLPESFAAPSSPLDAWLEKRFRDDVRQDRIACELLTAPLQYNVEQAISTFYQANEYKPENFAASTSRIFMGIRLECAQCHDHPFASYKRKQFWEFAAFFADVRSPNGPGRTSKLRAGEITIPGTGKVVQANLPGVRETSLKKDQDPRTVLAEWLTRRDNPYLARAEVNRLWAHFFGYGLVEPLDEMGEENRPSHPELLSDLAKTYAASGFDTRLLIRAITASKAYQLSSVPDGKEPNPRLFARMAVRGLSAEQVFDSVAGATWKKTGEAWATQVSGQRAAFLSRFASRDRTIDRQTSILQALHLMNGQQMAEAIDFDRNRALQTLAEATGQTSAGMVDSLYLTTLSRPPTREETDRLVRYIEQGGATRDKRKALSDILWALLNSPEFLLNH